MFWCVDSNRKDGYRWRCRRVTYASLSIRHDLWFQQGNLNFVEVLFLTYDMVRSYQLDREHVAAFEGIPQYLQPDWGYICQLATTCLRRGIDPTTSTSSSGLSASLDPWARATHLTQQGHVAS